MKKYELTIVIEVTDDVRADQIQVIDHDVCDGLEVLLIHDKNTSELKLRSFALTKVKDVLTSSVEDVQEVANRLGMGTLTKSQLAWVISSYEDAQRQDPTATWNLVVEDLLYMLNTNFQG